MIRSISTELRYSSMRIPDVHYTRDRRDDEGSEKKRKQLRFRFQLGDLGKQPQRIVNLNSAGHFRKAVIIAGRAFQIWSDSISKFRMFKFKFSNIQVFSIF